MGARLNGRAARRLEPVNPSKDAGTFPVLLVPTLPNNAIKQVDHVVVAGRRAPTAVLRAAPNPIFNLSRFTLQESSDLGFAPPFPFQ